MPGTRLQSCGMLHTKLLAPRHMHPVLSCEEMVCSRLVILKATRDERKRAPLELSVQLCTCISVLGSQALNTLSGVLGR